MNSIPDVVFFVFAALAIGSALVVVIARNVFHSALALTLSLATVGGFFALLGADFLAAAQILIYVGGIMIIMLFVVMLSQRPAATLERQTNRQGFWGAVLALAMASALIIHFGLAYKTVVRASILTPTSQAIGRLLMGDMVIPFEVVSLVLLAALVGAVCFASELPEGSKR
ncbi:MAG: NADH-quinone oxidoreductase subunit J [Elusimicrobiota bacterium]|jgi:NADH-quinone oxidoreductase subunit J